MRDASFMLARSELTVSTIEFVENGAITWLAPSIMPFITAAASPGAAPTVCSREMRSPIMALTRWKRLCIMTPRETSIVPKIIRMSSGAM